MGAHRRRDAPTRGDVMTPPHELVVISGKGGTGKTSVVAAFAALAGGAVLADCDVDAADLHLVLAPRASDRSTRSAAGARRSSSPTRARPAADAPRSAASRPCSATADDGYVGRPHRLRRLRALPACLSRRRHPHGARRQRRVDGLRDAFRTAGPRPSRRSRGQLRQAGDPRPQRSAARRGRARPALWSSWTARRASVARSSPRSPAPTSCSRSPNRPSRDATTWTASCRWCASSGYRSPSA